MGRRKVKETERSEVSDAAPTQATNAQTERVWGEARWEGEEGKRGKGRKARACWVALALGREIWVRVDGLRAQWERQH